MTPEELRQKVKKIYETQSTLDSTVTDLIYALAMAQAETMERLDRLIEVMEDSEDVPT